MKLLIERWKELEDKDTELRVQRLDGIMTRAQEVMDNDPRFLERVLYIISGEKPAVQKDGPQKPEDNSGPPVLELNKAQRAKQKVKDRMLSKFSADEIKGLCKSRYSLMSLEDFLQMLNRINSASSGNLLRDK